MNTSEESQRCRCLRHPTYQSSITRYGLGGRGRLPLDLATLASFLPEPPHPGLGLLFPFHKKVPTFVLCGTKGKQMNMQVAFCVKTSESVSEVVCGSQSDLRPFSGCRCPSAESGRHGRPRCLRLKWKRTRWRPPTSSCQLWTLSATKPSCTPGWLSTSHWSFVAHRALAKP